MKRASTHAEAERPRRPDPVPEFSRPVRVDRLGPEGTGQEIAADAGERAALAARFELEAIDSLTASFAVRPLPGGAYRVEGSFAADVVQTCVVTLDPVPAHVAESFELHFTEAPEAPPPGGVEVEPEGEDPPEPVVGGVIDLGEAVAQQLALALDPYPRSPAAASAPLPSGDAAGAGPFAALSRLRGGS